MDSTTSGAGGIGVSDNRSSRRSAEKVAVRQCIASGGSKKKCSVTYWYANGCMVMAKGTKGYFTWNSQDSLLDAVEVVMSRCQAETEEPSVCAIYHSACSLPMPIR